MLELSGHEFVQPWAKGLDVAFFVGREADIHVSPGPLAPEPGVQQQDQLVQRAGALVVRGDEEQNASVVSLAGLLEEPV